MLKKGSKWLWLLPAIALYLVGFGVATFTDLTINQGVYNPGSGWAIVMECFGWYPVFLPAILLLMLIFMAPAKQLGGTPWLRWPALAVLLGGTGFMFYDSYKHWNKRGMVEGFFDWRNLLLFAVLVGIWVAATLSLRGISGDLRQRLLFFALWGTAILVFNQVLIKLLKMLWQRTRFDDMLAAGGGFEDFTIWFRPLGNGGSSFPSGHTANATSILLLVVLCDVLPKLSRFRKPVYVFCWAYIILMAFSRIVIGRHYLSDTLAASAIMAGAIYAMRHTKWYQRGAARFAKQSPTKTET